MPKVNPEVESFARIKVIGAGGSGINAVNHMINSKVKGVEFIGMNTDAQDLHHSLAEKKIHIGKSLTKGLGAGMNPEIGKRAAEETKEEIQGAISGADMIFIACGLGGGTGTGSAPVIAEAAREEGALTVAVVTTPFAFEGAQRMRLAQEGIAELRKKVDAIIIIPNDRLLGIVDKETTALSAFAQCDEVLRQAVEGISDLITMPGIINVDFADIRSVMENAGSALMGIGSATGEKRAEEAAKVAINSPLLDISITGAKGVLFAIAGGDDMTMHEIQEAAKVITESIDADARVIFGALKDDKLKKGEIRVTVIATGFPEEALSNMFDDEVATGSSARLFDSHRNASDNDSENSDSGKIHNKVLEDSKEKKKTSTVKKQDTSSTTKEKKEDTQENKEDKEDEDDSDDDWGKVPSFLRRSRLK
jgi:cell division protein FtsZ